MVCVFGSRATTLSSVICGVCAVSWDSFPIPPTPIPWLFPLTFSSGLSAVEAKGQLRDSGEGQEAKKDAFPQRLVVILFLQAKSPG